MNYVLDYLRKRHKRVTTAILMDAHSEPREDWEAEMIAELPRQVQQHAQKLAVETREVVSLEKQ